MSSYRGIDLFGSGPHRFVVRGIEQRAVSHVAPGVDGERITPMGRSNRRIDQSGTLVGDDIASLEAQRGAIESAMDGQPGDLVDDVGRTHERVVMLVFDTEQVRRIGPRLAMDYQVRYAQVQP